MAHSWISALMSMILRCGGYCGIFIMPMDVNGRRSVCVDELFYNEDGTMQKVEQTTEGIVGK